MADYVALINHQELIRSLQKFAQVARDLAAVKEKISEKEEEVQELKSERNNTRVSRRRGEGGGGEVKGEGERDSSGYLMLDSVDI